VPIARPGRPGATLERVAMFLLPCFHGNTTVSCGQWLPLLPSARCGRDGVFGLNFAISGHF